MAHAGDVLENPAMRGRLVFRKTAAETGGELLEFEFFLEPRGVIAEEHVHPRQEERMEVLAGSVRGRVAGKEATAKAGEIVVMPPGRPHVWWNDGDTETHLRVEFRPALNTEELFETFFGLARDGKTKANGVPKILQMAVLLNEHKNEVYPAKVPVPLMKALVTVLAPVGRLRGYKAHYPEYASAAPTNGKPAQA
jgi:quercetin dioxygenase-like cupin family protein